MRRPANPDHYDPDSIYSDEKQYLLQREHTIGVDVGQKMYGLERSTPIDAIRDMIRNYYAPNTALENQNVTAVVYSCDETLPTQLGLANAGKKSDGETYSLCRIRVLSDQRHFWIPIPESSTDPAINLHPYVRYEGVLQVGTIVSVNFDNDKYQFASSVDIGKINGILDHNMRTYGGKVIDSKSTSLPPEVPANYLRGSKLLQDNEFNTKLEEVAKELKVSKQNLIKIMEFESTIDPRARSSRTLATGLIQWMPKTATEMHNTTIHAIRELSGVEQLELMKIYFTKKGVKKYPNASIGTLYLLVLYPYAASQGPNYVIGSQDKRTYNKKKVKRGGKWRDQYYVANSGKESDQRPKGAYTYQQLFAIQNPFPGASRGYVTKSDVVNKINSFKFRFA